jgi:hypothetical protein
MRRFVIPLTAALVWAAVLAQSAVAVPPLKEDLPPFSFSTVMTGVCPFPVTVGSTITGGQTTFYDRNGNVIKIEIENREQDVFSANGKTLVGLPYSFKLALIIDPATGEILHAYARGVAARIRLPSGKLFLTAGRLDFVDHPDELFVLQPDHGAQGDIAAFCAALSP